jgi:hypothetical protein
MARLLYVVSDADFRCRHEGLWLQAKKAGARQDSMKAGDIVAFLNTRKDMIATIAITGEKDSLGVLSFYRSPHGRVEPHAIQYIPECLGARGDLDMSKATRKALDEVMPKARRSKVCDEL